MPYGIERNDYKMIEITSINNPTVKHIKALALKKERQTSGEYTVEGIKQVNEAILSRKEIKSIVISEDFDITILKSSDYEIYKVPSFIFEKICDTKTPQGVLAVLKQEQTEKLEIKDKGLYLYCDGISDPGNMGTLIRTADAAGFDGVLMSQACVDLYSPKVVRSSMGSFFRMRVYQNINQSDLLCFKNKGVNLFGGALIENTKDYREADYSKTSIIIVGNEANGISDEVLSLCTPVKIPIYGGAESLNVAVAAGILMYEAANSKKDKKSIDKLETLLYN